MPACDRVALEQHYTSLGGGGVSRMDRTTKKCSNHSK
jgi:hypothetical protein